jgi:thioredoxin 1
MPAETAYRGPDETPTREEVDRMPGPVLLEFGTPSCQFCRALAPRVTAFLEAHPEVRHVKVEDGPGRPLGRSFQVRLWPNLVFLREGKIVRQLARPGYEQVEEAFRELLGAVPGRPAGE